MSDALIVEQKGRVVTLTNNDAPYNRMTLDFMDELEKTTKKLARDDSVGAIVLRGAGDEHFSVGMNLKQAGEGAKRKGSWEGVLDQRLAGSDWVAGSAMTIADFALYPYSRWIDEVGLSRRDWPAIDRWLDRVEQAPAFLPLYADGAAEVVAFSDYFGSDDGPQ